MNILLNDVIVRTGERTRGGQFFRLPRVIYQSFAFYFCWAVFGFLSLCWSVLAAGLYLLLPRRFSNPLGRFMIMAGFRMFVGLMKSSGLIKCDLAALDTLKGQTSLIIAPNHPSRLDVVLVVSRLPRVVCIMKTRLLDSLFLGGGARLAGYIRNDAPMDMIRGAAREVRNGQNLLIFPEGTRSTQVSLSPFGGGFALIGKFAGAPVQTVFIENVSGFLGKGWPLFKRPSFPIVFRVRLGRRFHVPDDVKHFVKDLEEYYREELGRDTATLAMPA